MNRGRSIQIRVLGLYSGYLSLRYGASFYWLTPMVNIFKINIIS